MKFFSNPFFVPHCSRFQNFYSGKLGHSTSGTSSFTRPPLTTHSIGSNQDQGPGNPNSGSNGNGIGGGNAGNGASTGQSQFLAPTPVNPIRSTPLQSIAPGGGNVPKPDMTANRLPQTHAINIGHPTFRSEFLR